MRAGRADQVARPGIGSRKLGLKAGRRSTRPPLSLLPSSCAGILPSICLPSSPSNPPSKTIMSKLNANAFSFVPGQAFRVPQQGQPAQPPPPPIERPPQTEAPAPPPTISLNIGGSKPAPPATISLNIGGPKPAASPAPAPAPAPAPVPSAPASAPTVKASAPTSSAPAASASTKAFTLDRAKTDTAAVAQDVRNAADDEVLKDLYGSGTSSP